MSGLRAHAGLLLAGVGGAALTWNPADKSTYITLSGGDLTAGNSGGNPSPGGVRGTVGHSNPSTPRQFEINFVGSNTTQHLVGVALAAANIDSYPGSDANGWSYYQTGQKYNAGSGAAYGAGWGISNVIGCVLDGTDLYFFKDGVAQGLAFSGLSGTLFPMWGPGSTGAADYLATLNTSLVYPVGGAVAW